MKQFPDAAARLAARTPNGERPVVMHHRWEALLFLHWLVSPAEIQQTLPPGLTVDTFEDQAYVAISPFFMRKVRPVGVPPLPWLSEFQELSVRTYVFDERGVPGIWFYSLDCDQPLAVAGAPRLDRPSLFQRGNERHRRWHHRLLLHPRRNGRTGALSISPDRDAARRRDANARILS